MTAIFPVDTTPNLKVIEGNAHDLAVVSRCLQGHDGNLVDAVVSTIGGKPVLWGGIDDPEVCRKGAAVLLEAIAELRRIGTPGNPYIIAVSSTGLSRQGRDAPLVIVPLYRLFIKIPHDDKIAMEDRLVAGQEPFTVVRASFLTNGESTSVIRVGIEDPKTGQESKAIGYSISREDAGGWIAENLVLERDEKYVNKFVAITY